MTKIEFQTYLKSHYPWVNDQTFALIDLYTETLREYNQKYNLTRLDSEDKIYSEYYLGSIINFASLDLIQTQTPLKVMDIGSGSGIPGILLKIIFPWIELTIIESNAKKCQFMQILSDKLGLKNQIINERAEVYFRTQSNANDYDLITSRAVAALNKILELSVPFLKIHGYVYLLKSKGYEMELKEAHQAIDKLHITLSQTNIVEFEDKLYVGLLFQKDQKTDSIYPRDWRIISSKPL